MTFIKKLEQEPESIQRDFANRLTAFLLPYFAKDSYINNNELQEDFQEFVQAEPEAYQYLLDSFLEDHVLIPENLTMEELHKSLTVQRWKMCSNCHEPFIAFDKKNKMVLCRKEIYRRHKADGTPFVSAINEESVCFMEWKLNQKKVSF